VDDLDLEGLGPKFEHNAVFPARTNTEFVEVLSPSHVRMVVWERGAGRTLACGTGGAAGWEGLLHFEGLLPVGAQLLCYSGHQGGRDRGGGGWGAERCATLQDWELQALLVRTCHALHCTMVSQGNHTPPCCVVER
jgi:hypothetical protein